MIRFLLLSAILILLGCTTSRPALRSSTGDVKCIQKFIPELKSEWYNTSVDVLDNHLSGLLLFKKLDDQSQRIVFTNEAGIKFFDFGFMADGTFKVYQALQRINKKAVINTFRKDFELLLLNKAKLSIPKAYEAGAEKIFAFETGKEADYVVVTEDCSQLLRLEKWGKKKMAEITFFGAAAVPDSITIRHFNFRMSIKMKKINR